MKALITDDSALARNLLQLALIQAGISDIDHACDGQESVAMAERNHYDIIFMDWNMPNMLGIDAVHEIRRLNPSVPIIMVTGLADELHIREAIQAGVNDYLIKPFRKEQAVSKIQSFLAVH